MSPFPKKTVSQTIPNSNDIIQQVGISSRSKAVVIPKISSEVFTWLRDKLLNTSPLELVSQTDQATGYLSDVSRHSEAGWVGVPLRTADSLPDTKFSQQLYDISFSLVKADNEQNIDTFILPTPPTTILGLGDSRIPPQTKVVFGQGLYWFFYSNSSGMVYQASPDGINWYPSILVTSSAGSTVAEDFAVWLDGTTLYYVLNSGGVSTSFLWRYGTIAGDGSISWSIPETAVTAAHKTFHYCSIAIDSSGNVWVITNTSSGTTSGYIGDYMEIWEFTSGSWVNQLAENNFSNYGNPCVVMPLTAGKMAFVYGNTDGGHIIIRTWYGAFFVSVSGPTVFNDGTWTAISIGDTIYFAGLANGSVIKSFSYPFGGPATSLVSITAFGAQCIMSYNTISNKLVLFITYNTSISSVVSTNLGASWSSPSIFGSAITSQGPVTPFSSSTSSYGVGWMNNNALAQLEFKVLTL